MVDDGCEKENDPDDNSENSETPSEENDEDTAEKSPDWIKEADLDELTDYGVKKEALEIVRRESREVLSERINLLRDIDDKAMRTVRTSVLLIGLVISAIQVSNGSISGVSSGSRSFQIGVAGVTFLLLSIVLGVYTYSASEPDFGVSDGHRTDVVEGEFTEKEWLLFQLGEYSEWIGNMRSMTKKNVVGLHLTLFTATAGIISLLISVVYNVGWKLGPLIIPALVAVIISAVIGLVYYVASESGR